MQENPKSWSSRVPQLDGLRGIAVGLVVLFHYGADEIPVIRSIASRGWVGVDLFFVLSGFLIGGIVIANKEADNLFSVFYLRRFLRIFPLYYLLLGTVAMLMWADWMPRSEHRGLFFYFVYLQNIIGFLTGYPGDPGPVWLQPTWSLAIEEQFYLILPALVVLTPSRLLKRVLVIGILIPISMRIIGFLIPVEDPRDFALFFSLCRCDALFYGVLLAWMVHNGHTSISIKTRIVCCYAGAAALLLGFLATYRYDSLVFTVGLSLLGPLFFCVVALSIMHEHGPVAQITKIKLLRWVGIRTYAIYLFHMPALSSVSALFKLIGVNPHGLTRPLALTLTLVCAAASWHLIEAPLIGLGHKLKYGRGAKPLVLTLDEFPAR